jgi:hypothetical protein
LKHLDRDLDPSLGHVNFVEEEPTLAV